MRGIPAGIPEVKLLVNLKRNTLLAMHRSVHCQNAGFDFFDGQDFLVLGYERMLAQPGFIDESVVVERVPLVDIRS